jgi:CheY-like chemotaxis protein
MAGKAKPLRVAIADDQPDVAQLMARLLLIGGYRVVAIAHDGQEALDAIRMQEPDVAILDIGMPGLTGYEVATQVRKEQTPGPLLIAVTGWGTDKDRADAKAAGFDAHLTKPAKWADVEALLLGYAGRQDPPTC